MSEATWPELLQRVRRLQGERIPVPVHIHDWERGKHMAEAFGVDGRRWHCAICGVPFWCMAQSDTPNLCDMHGGDWPEGQTYCSKHGPTYRWTP